MRLHLGVDDQGKWASVASELGSDFAQALSVKDFARIRDMLHPDIDFRGLTPNRIWEASGSEQVVDDVLRQWFEDSDYLGELEKVDSDQVVDRKRVGYRLRGQNAEGPFVVEQQAYFTERDGRIDWMRVVCSGFRKI